MSWSRHEICQVFERNENAMTKHAETRHEGMRIARLALWEREADYAEVDFHGDVFVVQCGKPIVVRPKITSGTYATELWPWAAPPAGHEDFYLFIDIKDIKRPQF